MSLPNRFDSGAQKRKKAKRREEFKESLTKLTNIFPIVPRKNTVESNDGDFDETTNDANVVKNDEAGNIANSVQDYSQVQDFDQSNIEVTENAKVENENFNITDQSDSENKNVTANVDEHKEAKEDLLVETPDLIPLGT